MTRDAIVTADAPAAIGPYSQAIASDAPIGAGGSTGGARSRIVFCSGQLGLDPASGDLVDGCEAQADRALRNLAAVLAAAGGSWADVVKTTVYLADIGDFGSVNAVYARHMPHPPPARSAPANVRLPHGLLVSIEAIAILPNGAGPPLGGDT
jgi:2-iminobutanoate/2-iminopropanoate deaminase